MPLRTQILIEIGVGKSTAIKSGKREWGRLFEGISFEEVRSQLPSGFIGGKSINDWLNEVKSRAERNLL